MAKVVLWSGVTRLDLPPDRILGGAIGKLETVVVIGYDADGDFYAASNCADGGVVMWLLEACKHKLMQHGGVAVSGE